MKRPNITPGEWRHDRDLICYGEEETTSRGTMRRTICALHGTALTEWKANARAIAALPKVLAALEELVNLEVCRNMHKAKAALIDAGYTFD